MRRRWTGQRQRMDSSRSSGINSAASATRACRSTTTSPSSRSSPFSLSHEVCACVCVCQRDFLSDAFRVLNENQRYNLWNDDFYLNCCLKFRIASCQRAFFLKSLNLNCQTVKLPIKFEHVSGCVGWLWISVEGSGVFLIPAAIRALNTESNFMILWNEESVH